MTNRLNNLRRMMADSGKSCLFVSSLTDICYLTGYTGSTAYLFVTQNEAVFLTDGRYEEQIKTELCEGIEAVIVRNYQQSLKECAERFGKLTLTYACGLAEYELLKDSAVSIDIDTGNMISRLRMVKDEGELVLMRDMYQVARDGFMNAFHTFTAGVREVVWAAELEKQMKMLGARCPSFDTIVGSGARGAMPHGIASEKIVEKNDPVVLDYGCKLVYCSDVTRLVIAGENKKAEDIADIVYTALKKASDTVAPGVRCCDVDRAAREYIESRGYGKLFNHSLGHGVGLDVHEKPVFASKDDTVLEPGMVITVEPGIYIPNEFGVRLEDTVVVTESGYENLTAVFDRYIYKSN